MKSPAKYTLFVVLCWSLLAVAPAWANEQTFTIFRFTNGLPYAKIPFRFVQNMIVLPVALNGQQNFNFILDTGTRTPVMLHKNALQGLNFIRGKKIGFSGAGTKGMVSGFTASGIDLSLPGVEAKGISIVVLEKNYLHVKELDNLEIHGILGATLFRSFVVNIDYLNQEISLIDKNTFLPCANYISLPMKIIDSKPVVEASLSVENELYQARLMIDTGFNNELLLRAGTYPLPAGAKPAQLGRGFGGTIKGKKGKIGHLKMNTLMIKDVTASLPTSKSYASNGFLLEHQGTIGNGLLRHYNIILDYAGEMFYIKSPLPSSQERVISEQTEAPPAEENTLREEQDLCFPNTKAFIRHTLDQRKQIRQQEGLQ